MSFHIPNDSNVTVSTGALVKVALAKMFHVLKIAIAFMLLIYFVFAITIVRFVPGVAGGAGIVLSKNDTFYGGIIPVSQSQEEKTQVLIDRVGTHDNSIFDNLKQSFTINPNTAIVDVYAGPIGKIMWEHPDIVTVNGRAIPGPLNSLPPSEENPTGNPVLGKEYLHNEYIGKCISGACEEGEMIIFSENQLMGVPVFSQS